MFSTQSVNCNPFVHIFNIIFLFAAELEEPKIGICGKGLRETIHFFFSRIMSLFDLEILSSIKHSTAEHWYLHAVLLFVYLSITDEQISTKLHRNIHLQAKLVGCIEV